MAAAEERRPYIGFLCTMNEILQVIILENRNKYRNLHKENYFKLCVNIKGISEPVPFISLLEDKQMPCFTRLICAMQAHEQESHVALQMNDNILVLWLEDGGETSFAKVKILNETSGRTSKQPSNSSVLHIRVFMKANEMIHYSKEMYDVLERIKFLNPQIQMLFTISFGERVEYNLSNTCMVTCDEFQIYTGQESFIMKYGSSFMCRTFHVACSKNLDMDVIHPYKRTSDFVISCLLCVVPICAVKRSNSDVTGGKKKSKQCYLSGYVRIQLYGPAGLPIDMNVAAEKLSLHPNSFLPWHKFGLQVKMPFKHSAFDLCCAARIFNKDVLPSWLASSDHFWFTFVFLVDERINSSSQSTVKSQLELYRVFEECLLVKSLYCKFQEAALLSMKKLLVKDKLTGTVSFSTKVGPQIQPVTSDLYKKMIPDIVNSLTDIFMRSTNLEFRKEISSLVLTSSRMSMSSSLEELLWGMIHNPVYSVKNVQDSPLLNVDEEAHVDNWNIEQDSFPSAEKDSMSDGQVNYMNSGVCIASPPEVSESPGYDNRGQTFFNLPNKNIISGKSIDAIDPLSFTDPDLMKLWIFSEDEQELELWKPMGDNACFKSVDDINSQYTFSSGEGELLCQEQLLPSCGSSVTSYKPSPCQYDLCGAGNSGNSNLRENCCGNIAATDLFIQASYKMPKKRSSEFMKDIACLDDNEDFTTGNMLQNRSKIKRTEDSDWYDEKEISNWWPEMM